MYLLGREPGVVLDIGCGNGKLATMLHSYGWEVCGQEFDVKAASIAKSRGVKVFVGELDAIVGAHIYDAIVMNHVVEHIPDPVNLLRNCKRLLKENGRLVITTPNADSLGAVLFQSYWRGYEAPRHLNIFTPKSLRSILFKSGFDNPVLSTLEFEAGTISFQSMSKFLQEHFKVDISSNYFIIRIFSAAFYLFEKILISFNPRLGEEILLVVDLKVCAELENE
jgi:2-polyprenyl-3-methyl-5-hydroxy-6-metoxy-1,4-benzoquinol methylase